MSQFVIEIGTEELPARFFPKLDRDLAQGIAAGLDAARLDHGPVRTLATPRRIAVLVDGLAGTQPMEEELVTGPPAKVAFDADGGPTKAAQGFARTHGVDVAEAFVQATDKGEYLAVRKTVGGADALDLLPAICAAAVAGLQFPKKMRWGSGDFGFGRPIQWLLALLDDQVVPFELAGLTAGRITHGHRVMGPGPFEVASAADYEAVLADKGHVAADPEARRATVRQAADALASKVGGSVVWNDPLLDEVIGLVEHPNVILGDFDPSFLECPREVLLTTMETHQKCFGVQGQGGALMPHFIATLNLEPADTALVRKGWERVLRARLEDARFFWRDDLNHDFESWLAGLDKVIFIRGLGSVGDKSRRMEALTAWLAETIGPGAAGCAPDQAARAGRLAKADLVTGLVGEFDELQGIMGGIYAGKKGEPEAVARAIYEHYLPEGPSSPVPSSAPGALVAMADKADTLLGCFGLGKIPTGANDPNALRRAVLGIVRIVLEHGLRLDLMALLAQAQQGYQDVSGGVDWKLDPAEALAKVNEFVAQRLRVFFRDKGFDTLVVEAAVGAGINDVWALGARVAALAEFSARDDFQQAVLTFKRAANIIVKQAGELGQGLDGSYDAALFAEPQEKALAKAVEAMAPRWDALWAEDDFPALLGLLGELRPVVDAFFDNVMVMCDDVAMKENRLQLLMALVGRLGRLADFSALQV